MNIIRYELGVEAPRTVDCMKLEELEDGQWDLGATALVNEESVSLAASDPYPSRQAAEDAGLAWAADHGVEELHLEVFPLRRRSHALI